MLAPSAHAQDSFVVDAFDNAMPRVVYGDMESSFDLRFSNPPELTFYSIRAANNVNVRSPSMGEGNVAALLVAPEAKTSGSDGISSCLKPGVVYDFLPARHNALSAALVDPEAKTFGSDGISSRLNSGVVYDFLPAGYNALSAVLIAPGAVLFRPAVLYVSEPAPAVIPVSLLIMGAVILVRRRRQSLKVYGF